MKNDRRGGIVGSNCTANNHCTLHKLDTKQGLDNYIIYI